MTLIFRRRTLPTNLPVPPVVGQESATGGRTIMLAGQTAAFEGVRPDDSYLQTLQQESDAALSVAASVCCTASGVCLDIGANIGVTAVRLARHPKVAAVFAFEPGADCFRVLLANLATNDSLVQAGGPGGVTPVNVAVGAAHGLGQFVEASAHGHLISSDTQLRQEGIESQVELTTVDRFLAERALVPDLVKVDVEGFEWQVFRGASVALTDHRISWYVEFNSWCLLAYGEENPRDFLTFLFDRFAGVFLVRTTHEHTTEPIFKRMFAPGLDLLHTNLIRHGCVSDLVLTNDAAKIMALEDT